MQDTPIQFRADCPLAPMTSWRIGGPAALLAEPKTPEELQACLRLAEDRRLPVLALGAGSNLLVSDAGYPGLVLRYGDQSHSREVAGEILRLRTGARVPLAGTARLLAREGWQGLEWAEGIPGTIGGAIVGNAGAYGGEIAACVDAVELHSSAEGAQTVPASECGFGYRKSRFKGQDPTRLFVLSATFALRRGDPAALSDAVREIGLQRRARTPIGSSCGSVFKNPPGASAGRLIEQAGLKGAEEGPAQISPLHANYIVNRGGATASQVLALIELARSRVRRDFSVDLELEVQLVGFGEVR